jgi:hypothetical protein
MPGARQQEGRQARDRIVAVAAEPICQRRHPTPATRDIAPVETALLSMIDHIESFRRHGQRHHCESNTSIALPSHGAVAGFATFLGAAGGVPMPRSGLRR